MLCSMLTLHDHMSVYLSTAQFHVVGPMAHCAIRHQQAMQTFTGNDGGQPVCQLVYQSKNIAVEEEVCSSLLAETFTGGLP